jgi:hypothetical protein
MLPVYHVAGLHREVHLDTHESYTWRWIPRYLCLARCQIGKTELALQVDATANLSRSWPGPVRPVNEKTDKHFSPTVLHISCPVHKSTVLGATRPVSSPLRCKCMDLYIEPWMNRKCYVASTYMPRVHMLGVNLSKTRSWMWFHQTFSRVFVVVW